MEVMMMSAPHGGESRAPLDERLEFVADQFATWAHDPKLSPHELRQRLLDERMSLCEFAEQLRQEYVRLSERPRPECPTVAQGVALAGRFHADTLSIQVTRGGFGLPESYLYVIERSKRAGVNDFHCGIDEDGRVSS
jgi:uncharacterized protein YcaQ